MISIALLSACPIEEYVVEDEDGHEDAEHGEEEHEEHDTDCEETEEECPLDLSGA